MRHLLSRIADFFRESDKILLLLCLFASSYGCIAVFSTTYYHICGKMSRGEKPPQTKPVCGGIYLSAYGLDQLAFKEEPAAAAVAQYLAVGEGHFQPQIQLVAFLHFRHGKVGGRQGDAEIAVGTLGNHDALAVQILAVQLQDQVDAGTGYGFALGAEQG